LRERAEASPDAHNIVEKALGVRRRNLPDTIEYNKLLKEMMICQTLELDINELNETGSALYVHHKYSSAVVEIFVGDEFFGAERNLDLKNRMRAYVKEVDKLSVETRKVVGVTSGPAYSADRGRRRSSRRAPRGGAALRGNRSFPPSFGMPANAPRE
jgi:hypothetical protein